MSEIQNAWSEVRQFMTETSFHRGSVERVAEMLPADDVELNRWIAQTVKDKAQGGFMFLTAAAASRERRMEAQHLAEGAMMMSDHQWLGAVAWRMAGDVPKYLLAAIQNTRLHAVCEAAALHLIAAWCQERGNGAFPETLITTARALARRINGKLGDQQLHVMGFLLALALRTQDPKLNASLRQPYPDLPDDQWKGLEENARKMDASALAAYREPILNLIQDQPGNQLAAGKTMRRAVVRQGRNTPCHCGSGKKYKHCCHDKDQARLRRSSEVAGLTQEELDAQPEPHLTAARLARTEPFEVAGFDPAKIPPELLDSYFMRLAAFKLLDRAVEAFEALGYSDQLSEAWENVMFMATRTGRQDIGQRLLKLREPLGFTEAQMDVSDRLLLAQDDPARSLRLIEETARKVLQTEDEEELMGLAYGVALSQFSALGILLYRGVIPLVPRDRMIGSLGQLFEARDRLNLPPDDPIGDLVDARLAADKEDESKDAAELRKAQRSLDAKAREVRELKESLNRLQAEIAHREKPARPTTPAPTAPRENEPVLQELRQKLEALKSTLKERHHERNELRRELQRAQNDLEALRQKSAPAANSIGGQGDVDREEDLLLPQESTDNQPLRLIEFPRGFPQALAGVPRHVARGALAMLGRLAGGEAAAFVGAVRLKSCPTITRHRIGIDYRLLFRLLPDRVQVVDLIPRQDLERKIKTLI